MSDALRIRIDLPRPEFALGVDLTLPATGISVIFGPSGSGKTTLLRCVAGLEPQARGAIRIGAETWQDDAAGVRLPVWKRRPGYVFQESSLFEHLDVRGNLAYGLRRARGPHARATLDTAVELLGIAPLMHRPVAQLSGGERQRVAIARALAPGPTLLLLDEPMASLDIARRREVLPWLERIHAELRTPMLYVTHALEEVARLADHLVILERGQVQANGPVEQVLALTGSVTGPGEEAGALLRAQIIERDPAWHLARAEFAGGSLWIRDHGRPIGSQVRIRVLARDVSVQLDEPARTSIQNHLHAVVEQMVDAQDPSQTLLHLRCGESLLLASITRRAAHTLQLAPQRRVWAQVKASAVLA